VEQPRVGLVAFGRPTFDLDAAATLLARSRAALETLPLQLDAAARLLTDPAAVARFVGGLEVDVLVCQFTTFVDDRFIRAAAATSRCPLLLWSLRETPRPGTRLALNSLTGANLAARALAGDGRFFRFILGEPGEAVVAGRVLSLARAAAVRRQLQGLRVLVLGQAPDGFAFADPDPVHAQALGVAVDRLDLRALFARALELPTAAWRPALDAVGRRLAGVAAVAPEQVERFARIQAVVEREVADRGASAVAVRCWPEFFTEFGAAACAMVSALTDRGVPAACEADVLGSLSMGVLQGLTGGPPYLGDLVAVDPARDAVVFWHCGAGAFSLASPGAGATAGVQPNRGVGLSVEMALKPGRVTITRLGETAAGLRLLVGAGEVLDAPQPFLGTAGTVRLDGEGPAEARVRRLVEAGWEPHYALAYGEARPELEDLAALLGIPAVAL
jgi:L-fucose isomerase-like protein